MNSRNIKLGYVDVTLLNGLASQAYIRDYTPATLQARVMVSGQMITAQWNGLNWIQVQG